MKIYHQVTRFSSRTGKPRKVMELKELRCDFTGTVIDLDDAPPYPAYVFDYRDADPCFGSDEEVLAFGDKHNINMYAFLSDEYVFDNGNNGLGADACALMLRKYCSAGDNYTFADICKMSRLATAQKLLDDKVITSDQLQSG
jgi:hypothetical protein